MHENVRNLINLSTQMYLWDAGTNSYHFIIELMVLKLYPLKYVWVQ